jgi:hypothetical protein
MRQYDTGCVSEKIHSMEIAIPELLVKAIALSVIAQDEAAVRHRDCSDIDYFLTPQTVDHDYIEAVVRPTIQYSIDRVDTRGRTVDRNKMQLDIIRHAGLQLPEP